MPTSNISSGLIAGLTRLANTFVGYMKDNIQSKNVPSKVSESISITPATSGDSGAIIDIVIDMKKGAAPMAAAYEWGSGVHATRGENGKYIIVSNYGQNMMKIPRSRWPNYTPPPNVDPVYVWMVEHPGVAARPYIQPILDDQAKMSELVRMVGDSVIAQVFADTSPVTVIEVRI